MSAGGEADGSGVPRYDGEGKLISNDDNKNSTGDDTPPKEEEAQQQQPKITPVPPNVAKLLPYLTIGWRGFLQAAMTETDFHQGVSEADSTPAEGGQDKSMKNTINFTQALRYFMLKFSENELKKSSKSGTTGGYTSFYEQDEADVMEYLVNAAHGAFRVILGTTALHSAGLIPLVKEESAEGEKDDTMQKLGSVEVVAEEEGGEGLESEIFNSANILYATIQRFWKDVRVALLKNSAAKDKFVALWTRFVGFHRKLTFDTWPKNMCVPANCGSYYNKSLYKSTQGFVELLAEHHFAPWMLSLFYPMQHALNSSSDSKEVEKKLDLIGQLPSVDRVKEIRATLLKYFESSKVMKELKAGLSVAEVATFKPAYEEAAPGKYCAVSLEWLAKWRLAHCPDEELSDSLIRKRKAAKEREAMRAVPIAEIDDDDNSSKAASGTASAQDSSATTDDKVVPFSPIELTTFYDFSKGFDCPYIKYTYQTDKLTFLPTDVVETFIFAYGGGPLMSHPFFKDPTSGEAVPVMEKVKFAVEVSLPAAGSAKLEFEEYKKPMTARQILFDICFPEFMNDDFRSEIDALMKKRMLNFEKVSYSYSSENDIVEWDEKVEWGYTNNFKITKGLEPGETKYPRGQSGLANLGNTCFMNAAIQCLSNCEPLRHKLIGAEGGFSETVVPDASWTIDKVNEEKSPVVYEFIRLLKALWAGQKASVNPKGFREAVVKRFTRFANYEQHDSIEFVNAVLDQMHEELNPVKQKKYRERQDEDMEKYTEAELQKIFWDSYLENNNTLFTPIFYGQTKSRLECVDCSHVRVVFDAFSCLPLSVDKLEKHTYDLQVYDIDGNTKYNVRVRVPLQSPIAVIKTDLLKMDFLKGHTHEEIEVLKWSLPRRSYSYSYSSYNMQQKPIQSFTNNRDETVATDTYEVWLSSDRKKHLQPLPPTPEPEETEGDKEKDGAEEKKKKNEKEEKEPKFLPFCRVLVNVHDSGDDLEGGERMYQDVIFIDPKSDVKAVHQHLWKHYRQNIEYSGEKAEDEETQFEDFCRAINFRLKLFDSNGTQRWEKRDMEEYAGKALIDKPHKFDDRLYSEFKIFFSGTQMKFKPIDVVDDKSLKEVPDNGATGKDATLEKCFERASNSHLVDDEVYCPKCKTHRQTIKEERAWVLPDVLIIQYKRFQFSMETLAMRKITTDVDFPVDLDMSPYVTKECAATQNCKYSLSGVILHSGTVSFGHYTATAWDSEGEKWVHYDDRSASEEKYAPHGGERSYIMFYQRVSEGTSSPKKAGQLSKSERQESEAAAGGESESHQGPPPLYAADP